MPILEINITDFQLAILSHKYVDVSKHVQEQTVFEATRYTADLANRLIQAALSSDNKDPKPMDRDTIVQNMLDSEGYQNAAQREEIANEAAAQVVTPIEPFIV